MNYPRDQHLPAVQVFLRQQIANQAWQITRPPHGTGQETYFASGHGPGGLHQTGCPG